MSPKVGDLISGKYRLIRVIGDGGMGTVFEARHEYLGTQVALKFLHPELAERQGLVARFLQEAQLAATLRSPYVAHVTDVDQTSEGTAYLVMELLHGQSLQRIIDKEKKLPPDRALDYTMQILAGLEAAHAIGVVHRDLKPDNVFVVDTPHGPLAKLLDFGIAKLRNPKEWQAGLTRPGSMMGTPEYMAPEQAYSADTVDARADVYAVGAMLYEMLLGRRPATGESAHQIAAAVMSGQVANLHQVDPSLPEGLARAVHRAMSPMPKDRFASVVELRQALLPFCRALSVAGRFAATPPVGGGVTPLAGVSPTSPEAPAGPTTEPGTPPPYSPAVYARPAQPAAPPVAQPYAQPNPPYANPGYAQPSPGYDHPAQRRSNEGTPSPARARGGRRGSTWLLLGTIALAVGVVAVIFATAQTNTEDPSSSSTASPTTTSAPVASAAAAAPQAPAAPQSPAVIAPPIQPANAPAPAHPATPAPAKPHPTDAGIVEASTAPAPQTIPGLPFPLPSALPLPFPSALPSVFPFPSGFPPFALPGFPPAKAQAAPAVSH
ncbi:MAG TPA: serine/threonine-protein kinase [Polyangiaceae bacterium]